MEYDYYCPKCKKIFYERYIEVEDEYDGWSHVQAEEERTHCPFCLTEMEEYDGREIEEYDGREIEEYDGREIE